MVKKRNCNTHRFTHRQLVRFEEICSIWERENKRGVSNRFIFANYVEYQYGIGETTFYTVLNIPVKRLLREMDDLGVKTISTDKNFNIIDSDGNKNEQ